MSATLLTSFRQKFGRHRDIFHGEVNGFEDGDLVIDSRPRVVPARTSAISTIEFQVTIPSSSGATSSNLR